MVKTLPQGVCGVNYVIGTPFLHYAFIPSPRSRGGVSGDDPRGGATEGAVPENRHSPFRAGTGQPGAAGAAPAGGARNPALGRSRDPTGGHDDPSARSSLDWDRSNGFGRAVTRDKPMRRTGAAALGRSRNGNQEARTRERKSPQTERREAPSRRSQGGKDTPLKACRAAAPAAQGVSQTPAFPGAPLPLIGGRMACHAGLPGAVKEYGRWRMRALGAHPPHARFATFPKPIRSHLPMLYHRLTHRLGMAALPCGRHILWLTICQ